MPGMVPSFSLKRSMKFLQEHHVVGIIDSHSIVEDTEAYRC